MNRLRNAYFIAKEFVSASRFLTNPDSYRDGMTGFTWGGRSGGGKAAATSPSTPKACHAEPPSGGEASHPIKMFRGLFLSFLFLALLVPKLNAQQKAIPTTRVLFIFDASFSMYDTWQKHKKIDIAKRILVDLVDSLKTLPHLQMALRTLGADYPLYPQRNCEDTRLVVPFGPNNYADIEDQIKQIEPRGTTPIAFTLGKCISDFTPCENCRNVIVLITDGIEECGGDPCDIAKDLLKNGITLKPFVIGIGKENFSDAYSCMGKFFDVKQEEDFKNVLKIVISQALNSTTAQVNLNDIEGKPTETDVAMTFYDEASGRRVYNFMHTINNSGNPDTMTLDPNVTYHLVVHTIPEVDKHNITLTQGKHNIIALKAPQGYLHVMMDGDNEYKALYAIIRKADHDSTLNLQQVESTDKYIVGKYDLEILTLPRMYVSGVKIVESTTTTITIPQAGVLNLTKPAPGPISLYTVAGDKMNWVCNLDMKPTQQSIVLQPGHYRAVYRSIDAKETIYTVDKEFDISPGSSTTLQLY
jgi:Ca-activated chloride channel family protein